MFRIVPKGLLVLFLSLFQSQSHAENLLEIFQLALENDPQLKAAQSARQAVIAAHPQSVAKLYPNISVEGQIGKTSQDLQKALAASNEQLTTEIYDEVTLSITLTQPLFNVQNFRNMKIADIALTQADLHYRIAQQDLLFRVAERYFAALSGIDDLNFARAEKNAIARQLKQTQQRFDVGLTAVTDVHEAQARHDLALAQEIKAEGELANKREDLRRITGQFHQHLVSLKQDTPLTPPTPANMDDWTEAARGQNLHIAEIKIKADIIKQEMNVIRAGHYPTLDFSASYGYYDYGGAYLQRSLDANVSLNFKMPIFEGNIIDSKLKQKRHIFEQQIQKIDIKEREILQQTRDAYLGVLAGMSYVKALSQALKSSEKALNATNAGFEVGTRTAIEVLNAQRELFRSQRDYARSRYEYILNMMRLKVAVGLLSIDDLEQVNHWLR